MTRFLIFACLACFLAGPKVVAASAFPWFHTRAKSVMVDDPPAKAQTATPNRVAYHGSAAYPGSGRLYFEDAYDHDRRLPTDQPSRSRFADVLSRTWRLGGEPARTNPTKSK